MARLMKLGCGRIFISASPFGFSRLLGIMLPGKGAPDWVSVIGITLPLVSRVCEKSPERSSAVGIVYEFSAPGVEINACSAL